MVCVEYSSNNSGGRWWLSDKDWRALEDAGWEVYWGGSYYCHSTSPFNRKPAGKPEPCEPRKCQGHRRCDNLEETLVVPNGRWLGAAARNASKEFANPKEAILEFERVTKQRASDEGCNCCGPPHTFSWERDYVSGEECLQVLWPGSPKSLREVLEQKGKW